MIHPINTIKANTKNKSSVKVIKKRSGLVVPLWLREEEPLGALELVTFMVLDGGIGSINVGLVGEVKPLEDDGDSIS